MNGIQLISLLCKDLNTIKYHMLKLTISDFLFQIETIIMGILPSPYQQLFEINKGIQSLTVTFKGAQRQSE